MSEYFPFAMKVIKNVPKDLLCEHCGELPDYPGEFDCCGKLCCSKCQTKLEHSCEKNRNWHRSTRVLNTILNLQSKCPNVDCQIETTIKELLQTHFKDCPFTKVKCETCNGEFMNSKIENHLEDCLIVNCKHKSWSGCNERSNRKKMEIHQKDFAIHMQISIIYADSLNNQLEQSKDSNKKLQEEMKKSREELIAMKSRCERLSEFIKQAEAKESLNKLPLTLPLVTAQSIFSDILNKK